MKKIIALACLVISTHISAEENKFYGGLEAGFLAGAGYYYDLNDDVQIRGAYSYYDSLGGITDADMHLVTIGIKF